MSDLVDMSRNLLNKNINPFEQWIANIKKEFNDPKIISEFFLAGKSKGKCPSDFDGKKIVKGLRVELEHTTNNYIATKIVMDHLVEDINYYEKLSTIDKDAQ